MFSALCLYNFTVEKQENHKKQLAIMEQIIIDLKEDNQTVNEKFEHLQSANAALNNYIKQLQEEKESDKVEENEMIQNYHKQIEALQHELQQVTDQAKANVSFQAQYFFYTCVFFVVEWL